MRWGCLLFLLLFFTTWAVLVPPSIRLADPMTNAPLDLNPDLAYPVLVLVDGRPGVVRLRNQTALAAPPRGTFLVPAGQEPRIVKELNRLDPRTDGGWQLRVKQVAPDVQDIELFWMHNGYGGSGYRATATTATLRYMKLTGPGFGMIVGMCALLINSAAWGVILLIRHALRHNHL